MTSLPIGYSGNTGTTQVLQAGPGNGGRLLRTTAIEQDLQLCIQTFPLPTPDEIFSVIANGESFSKIDLARAYKQMRVAKGSQSYLIINTPLGLYSSLRLPWHCFSPCHLDKSYDHSTAKV